MILPVKTQYWELLYDQSHHDGWNLGIVSYINAQREVMWIVDGLDRIGSRPRSAR